MAVNPENALLGFHVGVSLVVRCMSDLSISLPWPPEEEDVAVGIGDFEAAQTVARVLERFAEGCAVIGEFGGERIGVG